ncbi:MKL/myocardin-like protein 2 [Sinocyclocheilus rhinocerous]|nr:PREDICTED: MKL/myocardin-like protein 2 [Sinocyclocheilus rhinocerous]
MEPQESLGVEGKSGALGVLVPSPRSEAVTHDLEELSLQPTQSLPPIKERKNVLQLRLQQRRTREQLADQGIMPPLKTPGAFHGQLRSLERARTVNFLKHKIRSRPDRAELVRMHILQETHAEPSLQATQMKLKRARLADDLNEKIAQRPGPMELVEKNILPVDIVGGLDVYNFNEDSSEALSPEQPASHESQGSACSPVEARLPDPSSVSPPTGSKLQSPDFLNRTSAEDGRVMTATQLVTAATPTKPAPTLVKVNHISKLPLHLKSLILLYRPVAEIQNSCPNINLSTSPCLPTPIMVSLPNAAPSHPNNTVTGRKTGSLPTNLDEMKVAELKMELKLRGLPVSGTKTDLIERLKAHQESSQSATTMDTNISKAPLQPDSMSTTPPISPEQSEASYISMEDSRDSPTKALCMLSPVHPPAGTSPLKPTPEDMTMDIKVSEKDQRLHEKECQIEELMRKLEQEQRLVEELKMQLEVEKRSQQGGGQSCNSKQSPLPQTTGVKQEEPHAQLHHTPVQQFYINTHQVPQVLHQKTLINTQPATQILLPISRPNNPISTQVQTILQPTLPSIIQTPLLQTQTSNNTMLQQHSSQTPSPPQALPMCGSSSSGFEYRQHQNQPMTDMPQCFLNNSPRHTNGPINKPPSPCQLNYIFQPLTFPNHHSPKSKDPPRYEEAVKQTRGLQATVQVPTATSQHMDDLFDVLIESGEISPLSRQDPSLDKLLPVTANITTLPINTVLSREEKASKFGTTWKNALGFRLTDIPYHKYDLSLSFMCSEFKYFELHLNGTVLILHTLSSILNTFCCLNTLYSSIKVPTATSQHMDDLFDVLIESGEISPLSRQDPSLDKLLPVTANITTLPINTVLSRPPPQIHVARTPNQTQAPSSSLVALASDNQLEALLEDAEPRTLRMMEELKNQLLERPHSPMDTSDLTFTDTPPSALPLQDAGLDNMEWLDLTIPGPAGICSPTAVFSSDFLDSTDLQLHWD